MWKGCRADPNSGSRVISGLVHTRYYSSSTCGFLDSDLVQFSVRTPILTLQMIVLIEVLKHTKRYKYCNSTGIQSHTGKPADLSVKARAQSPLTSPWQI